MESSLTKPDMESTTDSGGIGIPSGSIGMAAPDKESRAAALEYARTLATRRAALRERMQRQMPAVRQVLRRELETRHADATAAREERREEWRARRDAARAATTTTMATMTTATAMATMMTTPTPRPGPLRHVEGAARHELARQSKLSSRGDRSALAARAPSRQSYSRAFTFWEAQVRLHREAVNPARPSMPAMANNQCYCSRAGGEHVSRVRAPLARTLGTGRESGGEGVPHAPHLTGARLRPLLRYWITEEWLRTLDENESALGIAADVGGDEGGDIGGASGSVLRQLHRDQRLAAERERRQALLSLIAARREAWMRELADGAGPPVAHSGAWQHPQRSSRESGPLTRRGVKEAPLRWRRGQEGSTHAGAHPGQHSNGAPHRPARTASRVPRQASIRALRAQASTTALGGRRGRGRYALAATQQQQQQQQQQQEQQQEQQQTSWLPSWLGRGSESSLLPTSTAGALSASGTSPEATPGWMGWLLPWATPQLSPHAIQVAELGAALGAVGALAEPEAPDTARTHKARKLLESRARAAERSEHRRATEHEALTHGGEHENAGAVTGAGASPHSLQLRQGQVARADWGAEERRAEAELLAEQTRLEAEKEALRQRLKAEAAAAAAAARAKAEKERKKLEESQARAIARAEMRRSGSKVTQQQQQQQQQQAESSWLPSWLGGGVV